MVGYDLVDGVHTNAIALGQRAKIAGARTDLIVRPDRAHIVPSKFGIMLKAISVSRVRGFHLEDLAQLKCLKAAMA